MPEGSGLLHTYVSAAAEGANPAKVRASAWNAPHSWRSGYETFGAVDVEITVTLSPAEANAAYLVTPGLGGGSAGSPFVQIRVKPGSQLFDQFILQLNVAPGGSETVIGTWILTR